MAIAIPQSGTNSFFPTVYEPDSESFFRSSNRLLDLLPRFCRGFLHLPWQHTNLPGPIDFEPMPPFRAGAIEVNLVLPGTKTVAASFSSVVPGNICKTPRALDQLIRQICRPNMTKSFLRTYFVNPNL